MPAASKEVVNKETDLRKRLQISKGGALGSGSYAIVYRATWVGRSCALKVLRPEHATAAQRAGRPDSPIEMLRREGEVLIRHPHRFLSQCYAVLELPPDFPGLARGYTRSTPALVLELMEDGSLYRLLRRQQLAPWAPLYDDDAALEWSTQIAAALAHLHGLSPAVIHRDVKLDNLLLQRQVAGSRRREPRRVAKLIDLGLHVKPHEERHRRQPLFRVPMSFGELSTRSIQATSASSLDYTADGRTSAPASLLHSPLFLTKLEGTARLVPVNPRCSGFRNLDKPLMPVPLVLLPPPSPPLPPLAEAQSAGSSGSVLRTVSQPDFGPAPLADAHFARAADTGPEEIELREGSSSSNSGSSCIAGFSTQAGGMAGAPALCSSDSRSFGRWSTRGTLALVDGMASAASPSPETHGSRPRTSTMPLIAEDDGCGHGRLVDRLDSTAQLGSGRPFFDDSKGLMPRGAPCHDAGFAGLAAVAGDRHSSQMRISAQQQQQSAPRAGHGAATSISGGAGAQAMAASSLSRCRTPVVVDCCNGNGRGRGGDSPGGRGVALLEPSFSFGEPIVSGVKPVAGSSSSTGPAEAGGVARPPCGLAHAPPRGFLRASAPPGDCSAASIEHLNPPCEAVFRLTGATGSCMTMAPEVFLALPYNEKADVFSFGVVLYELFSRSLLLATQLGVKLPELPRVLRRCDEYTAVVARGYRPARVASIPEPVWQLIGECWLEDPVQRPAMSEVLGRLQALARRGPTEDAKAVVADAAAAAGGVSPYHHLGTSVHPGADDGPSTGGGCFGGAARGCTIC